MAIITNVPGLEVTVLVRNQPITEYNSQQRIASHPATKNTVVKYIESHDDTSYSVHIATSSQYAWDYRNHAIQVKLYVDGIYGGNWIFGREEGSKWFEDITYYDYKQKRWFEKKMQFSAVKIVEEEAKPNIFNSDAEGEAKTSIFDRGTQHNRRKISLSSLGNITVEIFRGIAIDLPRPAEPIGHLTTPMINGIELEEKSLKGRVVTHASTFSAPKPVPAPISTKFETLPEDKRRPIATVKFLYRSREGLRIEGIIPSYSSSRATSNSSTSLPAYPGSILNPITHNAARTPTTMPEYGVKVKDESTSDDEKENKPVPLAKQSLNKPAKPRSISTNKPRQTTIQSPASSPNVSARSASLAPMFLEMQQRQKRKQNRVFMAALSRNSSASRNSSRASSVATRSASPAVGSASSLLARSGARIMRRK